MSQLILPPHPNTPACAGQGCPERSECLRYLRPAMPSFKRKDGSWVVQHWASFDIERVLCEGRCAAKQAPFGSMGRALAGLAA